MRKTCALLLSGIIILGSSCASIVSKSKYPITINSRPSDAKITITDKKGVTVFSGLTPAMLKLDAGAGFFSKARYQVTFEKDGYVSRTVPVNFKLDGWYFGNILFGGLIGLLIVDPATGAMYKIDTEFLDETLEKENGGVSAKANELRILDINDIPAEWKEKLVAIN
ncbi:peptidase associated/transthyretin-like domain-containing protein [Bacteroides graminisolvens]|uniref:PEGA domain-containing protein n=1 Tax=Bacteroides graminisolvens DSM 19988 = JCM 15093 TaxID=1121097 RepID=A0A069CZN2_9BACE|nr:hypothetical protein [Bacteroides graminisolvens]GAK35652.1 hypothetical protein JCM15093_762 [Bacteroides graminisolvens DSM 19988 = JCM 15093]